MTDTTAPLPPESRAVLVDSDGYPYSDGRVLMEGDDHANAIVEMRNQLQGHFEHRPHTYVAGSMAVYYRRGDKEAVLEPDVFVVLGVEKRDRKSYKIWEEGGAVLSFVVEVVPPATSSLEPTSKRTTYERIGVPEFWRFDPDRTSIPQGLEGWRLEGASYERVRETRQDEGVSWHQSLVLELDLRADGKLLRFRNPLLGRSLLTYSEECQARRDAEQRADRAQRWAEAEAAARRNAECRAANAERERDEADRRILELEARLRVSG